MRSSTALAKEVRFTGASGIDPHQSHEHLALPSEDVSVRVVDYSHSAMDNGSEAAFLPSMNNDQFLTWLDKQPSPAPRKDMNDFHWCPDPSKDTPQSQAQRVQYICCEGISWDVVKALGRRYNLHPLAVEVCDEASTSNMC